MASAWATTDVLTAGDFEATSTTYKDFSGVTKDSGAVYAGNSGKSSDGAIQLRSNNSNSGIVTTESGGTASKVTLAWNAATVDDREVSVYGSTDAYTAATDLYAAASQGTLLGSLKKGDGATELEIEGEYAYIGLRSKSGALYLDSVEIEWVGGTPPVFSVKLDPAEDFEVFQGKDASITATVKGAQGTVTYSWSVNGNPIDLAGNVYTVDSAEVGGPYEVACEASDGVSDPVSASVSYSVVEAPVVSGDVLTRETTGVEGSNYKDWTATGDSGTKYAGQSAGGNDSIQLRTTSPAGIVITESAGSDVASVTVEWNEGTADKRSIEIYGSADAYAGPADLYGDAKGTLLGTLAKGETTLEVPEGYPYVGILAKGGALYLTSVAFEFAGASGPSVSLSASATEVEVGDELTITATAKNFSGEVSWAWEGDDGGSAEANVYSVNTAAAGEYTVKATATYGEETADKEIKVTVAEAKVPHAITVTVEGNGTAEADVATAKAGEPVTLTVVPGEGCKVGSITVNGTAITGTSFDMLDEDVAVVVTFVEKPVLSGDVLTRETTGVEGSNYKEWTVTGDSGTKYAGQSAGGNDSIQLRTTSPAGIVITESAGSDVASVTVEWNEGTADKRSIEIYGSADAYAGPADLYGDAKGTLLGTLAKGETTLEVPEGYPYVGILAKGGALYLTSVAFEFAGASGPSVSLSASATEVEVGDELTITATAKNFSGEVSWAWEGDDGGSAEANVYTVNTAAAGEYMVKATATCGEETADKEIKVTVAEAKVPHAITVTVEGNGTAEADVPEAKAGEPVTLTVVPGEGCKVGSITVNGTAISGTTFDMLDEDVTVVVTFVEKPVVSGDVLTNDDVGTQSGSYVEWTAEKESGAVYAGQSAGGSATNPCIQLRSNNSNSGIVMTKDSGQNVSSVTIEWNAQSSADRVVQVYGSATPYSSPADLYGDAKGTLLGELANGSGEVTVDVAAVGEFPYIGIRSKSGAIYLTSVAIDFGGAAAFSITLAPAEDFEVQQGKDASITATVRSAQGDVTYSWSVDGNPINLSGNVYAIDSAEVGGPFEVVCEASDGVSEPVSASVSYTVVEVPPVTGDEFALITSVDDLQDGTLVVLTDPDGTLALSATVASSVFTTTAVDPISDVITTDNANIIWKLVDDGEGNFSLYNEEAGKYAGHAGGGTSNSGRLQDDPFPNAFSVEDGLFVVAATTADSAENYRDLQFNQNGTNPRFAYYKGTQKNLRIYAAESGPAKPSITYSGDLKVKIPDSFSIQFTLKNYEGDYTWAVTSREGGSITEDGLYTWKPAEATDGISISVAAIAGETEIATKTLTLVVEPKDEPGPGEPTLTCAEGTTIDATVGKELVLHFTLTNAEFYTGESAEDYISDGTEDFGVVSDVTATTFVYTCTPTTTGTVNLNFQAVDEEFETIIESYPVTLNVTEGGGGGDAVTVKSCVVNDDGSVTVTLSDGSTTSSGLQYSTDLKNWSTTPVNVKTAASAFVRVGAPE